MRLDLAGVLNSTNARAFVRMPGGVVSPGQLSPADLQRAFSDVEIDSRSVGKDCLFVALPGERSDGHEFIPKAFERGALGCLVSRLPSTTSGHLGTEADARYLCLVPDTLAAFQNLARAWRLAHSAEVIGVTGSIGKTTTKEIIASVLSWSMPVLKSEANLNTEIGLPLMLLQLTMEHRAAVLEMGMYVPGDIALLADIARPGIGVVTNVAPIHLERVGSIERIARTKSELVTALPEDGLAILNGDDPWTRAMARVSGLASSVLVGLSEDCDIRAVDITPHGLDGTAFTVLAEGQRFDFRTRVPGAHTVSAFLSAIAVARSMEIPWSEIMDASAEARLSVRQRILRRPDGVLIIDDSYNAAPMSMSAALELLKSAPGTKIAVLGDMLELGPHEESAHRDVGVRAAGVADWLVVRGDRSEWIAQEALSHGFAQEHLLRAGSNEEAIQLVRDVLAHDPSSAWSVLVKGSRGMRMEEVVRGLRGTS